jgi:endo-1,4-beta-xylanase
VSSPITFSGWSGASAGTNLVSIYGWSTGPLVEYYIEEWSYGGSAGQGQVMGSVTSDGSSYTIWKHTQYNQPSIQGTSTFNQYISVRDSPRSGGGTVTVANHFNAWANLGMNLGQLSYQVLATEGWGGAQGESDYTVS